MRGSGGSFGITTSIEAKTFPAPPSATVFTYEWTLDVAGTAKGIGAFQSFVQTNISPQLGGEINLFRGSKAGTVVFSLTGGWYGPAKDLNATIAPLLKQMPSGPKITQSPGSYINSVANLAGGSLDTRSTPDGHDTFYAKSLMTPEASPMSSAALTAFAHYLANEGFASKTVRLYPPCGGQPLTDIERFRNGLCKLNSTVERTRPSTLSSQTTLLSLTEAQCSLSNSMRRPQA
jgi:hypothetical protein